MDSTELGLSQKSSAQLLGSSLHPPISKETWATPSEFSLQGQLPKAWFVITASGPCSHFPHRSFFLFLLLNCCVSKYFHCCPHDQYNWSSIFSIVFLFREKSWLNVAYEMQASLWSGVPPSFRDHLSFTQSVEVSTSCWNKWFYCISLVLYLCDCVFVWSVRGSVGKQWTWTALWLSGLDWHMQILLWGMARQKSSPT